MEELCCDFKYSGAARAILAAAVACTAALVVLAPFPAVARVLALAWVAALALHAHRVVSNAAGVRLGAARAIAVRDRRGAWHPGQVCDGSFVAPWLTIVRWRPEGSRRDRTLVILPDMLSRAAMRRIRVILRWA